MEWVIVFVWVVCAMAAGSWIGWKIKGRPLTGFLLGFALGWIGVIIIALVPPSPEMRVQNRMRDQRVDEEVARRRAGGEPWSGPSAGQEPPFA